MADGLLAASGTERLLATLAGRACRPLARRQQPPCCRTEAEQEARGGSVAIADTAPPPPHTGVTAMPRRIIRTATTAIAIAALAAPTALARPDAPPAAAKT